MLGCFSCIASSFLSIIFSLVYTSNIAWIALKFDAARAQRILGQRERHLDQLDVLLGIDAVTLEHQVERSLRAAADDRDADGLALEVLDLLDRGVVLHGPIDREAAGLFADVLRHH